MSEHLALPASNALRDLVAQWREIEKSEAALLTGSSAGYGVQRGYGRCADELEARLNALSASDTQPRRPFDDPEAEYVYGVAAFTPHPNDPSHAMYCNAPMPGRGLSCTCSNAWKAWKATSDTQQAQPLTDEMVALVVQAVNAGWELGMTVEAFKGEFARIARDRMAQQAQPVTDDDASRIALAVFDADGPDSLHVVREVIRRYEARRDRMAQQAQPVNDTQDDARDFDEWCDSNGYNKPEYRHHRIHLRAAWNAARRLAQPTREQAEALAADLRARGARRRTKHGSLEALWAYENAADALLALYDAAPRERTCEHDETEPHDIEESSEDDTHMVITGWCPGPAQENDHE